MRYNSAGVISLLSLVCSRMDFGIFQCVTRRVFGSSISVELFINVSGRWAESSVVS